MNSAKIPQISQADFGRTKRGEKCVLFRLRNASGVEASITNFGATLASFECFDRLGGRANICIGFDNLAAYEAQSVCVGAVVGRYANRIANGRFSIGSKNYALERNQGENTLHGGSTNFAYRVWEPDFFGIKNDVPTLTLTLFSADGEGGFPGNLSVAVTYRLFNDNRLCLDLAAETDVLTPVSLTHHAYFNLAGNIAHRTHNGLNTHRFQIYSDKILAIRSDGIPTGKYRDVTDTVFDLRNARGISDTLNPLAADLEKTAGFDHNYCFPLSNKTLASQATVFDMQSGRTLEVLSTMPGLQFYTANYLDRVGLRAHSAFCLEPQYYPDSPNQDAFPFDWTSPDNPYLHRIEWRVGVNRP